MADDVADFGDPSSEEESVNYRKKGDAPASAADEADPGKKSDRKPSKSPKRVHWEDLKDGEEEPTGSEKPQGKSKKEKKKEKKKEQKWPKQEKSQGQKQHCKDMTLNTTKK